MTRRRLKVIELYDYDETDSEYFGTDYEPVLVGEIKAVVQPAENKLYIEMYGERINDMLQLTTMGDIKTGQLCAFVAGNPTHKAISVKEYIGHKIALVEATHGN